MKLNGAFPQPFVWRNYISIAQGENFPTEVSGNIISSHKRLWKCHSHCFNDQNIHLFPEGFEFISCRYLHFILFCIKSWNKINEKPQKKINGYFYIRKLHHFNVNDYLSLGMNHIIVFTKKDVLKDRFFIPQNEKGL